MTKTKNSFIRTLAAVLLNFNSLGERKTHFRKVIINELCVVGGFLKYTRIT